MGAFAYKALTPAAAMTSGTVIADSPRHARDILRDRGLTVDSLQALEDVLSQHHWRQILRHGRAKRALPDLLADVASLLAVGTPLVEAIDIAGRDHADPLAESLAQLRDRITAGASLSEAMQLQPDLYDTLTISMISVGEKSGALGAALQRVAAFKQRTRQFRNRLTTALFYPGIVLATGTAVALFLMTFVVPNILSSLAQAGKPLPLATRIVKGASDLLLGYWWGIPIAIAIGCALWYAAARQRRVLGAWHRLELRIPVWGELVRKQGTMQVAIVLAALLRSGVVLTRAMEIAQQTTGNLVLREALARCGVAIEAGKDLAAAVNETQAFSPVVVQMFSMGQQTGRLEEMLERLVEDYDRQLAVATQRFTALLEPLLILVLAALVGFVAFATVLPILEASNVL